MINQSRIIFLILLASLLTSCGFHLQGPVKLAPPLHRLYLQTPDPYSQLSRSLTQNLKASNVVLVASAAEADTVLVIVSDTSSEIFLNVSDTQQTRQYTLNVTVVFEITDRKGRIIIPPQSLTETRAITVQSDQILGSSNEANLFYQQMRRTLAYAIMNRIASKELTRSIQDAFTNPLPDMKKT